MGQVTISTPEQFFKAAAPKTKPVDIPEFGETIAIRQLSVKAWMEIVRRREARNGNDPGSENLDFIADMVMYSVVDESSGELMFTEADLPAIKGYAFNGLLRLNHEISAFNGFGANG
jgi:hypothetical protein